jgi:hypothetical protein
MSDEASSGDWPTIRVTDGMGNAFDVFINDSKHVDDHEPARIVCWRCGKAFVVTRGEIMANCSHCLALNRGYGTTEQGEPLIGDDDE